MSRVWSLTLLPIVSASKLVSIPTKEITPGVNMPLISIGTGGLERDGASAIISTWLSNGGRGIDTANNYNNQLAVGQAIRDSGLKREELFITTKIPICDNATDLYVQQDLQELGVDYIDLLLIHYPKGDDCGSTWANLEKHHAQGVLKAIGISQFRPENVTSLMKTAKVVPHMAQMWLNVLQHDDDQIAAHLDHGINVEAFSPLGRSGQRGNITGNPTIQAIAAAHSVSTYQIAIKWILQKGYILTFQSSNADHQHSDADVFTFELSNDEMATLDGLQSQLDVIV